MRDESWRESKNYSSAIQWRSLEDKCSAAAHCWKNYLRAILEAFDADCAKSKLNTSLTEWSGLNEVDEDDEVFEGNRETVEHPVRCNQDLMSGVLYSQK